MNFDFSHLKSPPFPKLILLYGLGMGKTTVRQLLEEKYREQGIDCLVTWTIDELLPLNTGAALAQSKHRPEIDLKKDFEGVIFLELNSSDFSTLPFVPTYAIYFPTTLQIRTSVNRLPDSTNKVTSKS